MPDSAERPEIILYLNSERVVRILPADARDAALGALHDRGENTFPLVGGWMGHAGASSTAFDSGNYARRPVISTELSEDEQEALRLVQKLVSEQHRQLHVVDLGQKSALHRLISEHLHHIRRFPALVRSDGRRLEGIEAFTPETLASFLSD